MIKSTSLLFGAREYSGRVSGRPVQHKNALVKLTLKRSMYT